MGVCVQMYPGAQVCPFHGASQEMNATMIAIAAEISTALARLQVPRLRRCSVTHRLLARSMARSSSPQRSMLVSDRV